MENQIKNAKLVKADLIEDEINIKVEYTIKEGKYFINYQLVNHEELFFSNGDVEKIYSNAEYKQIVLNILLSIIQDGSLDNSWNLIFLKHSKDDGANIVLRTKYTLPLSEDSLSCYTHLDFSRIVSPIETRFTLDCIYGIDSIILDSSLKHKESILKLWITLNGEPLCYTLENDNNRICVNDKPSYFTREEYKKKMSSILNEANTTKTSWTIDSVRSTPDKSAICITLSNQFTNPLRETIVYKTRPVFKLYQEPKPVTNPIREVTDSVKCLKILEGDNNNSVQPVPNIIDSIPDHKTTMKNYVQLKDGPGSILTQTLHNNFSSSYLYYSDSFLNRDITILGITNKRLDDVYFVGDIFSDKLTKVEFEDGCMKPTLLKRGHIIRLVTSTLEKSTGNIYYC